MIRETGDSPDLVAIVGSGVVGYATGRALSSLGHEVHYVDVSESRRQVLAREGIECSPQLELSSRSTIILVSVPTPTNGEGHDLTIFTAAIESIGIAVKGSSARHVIVTRSTVPPRTAVDLVTPTLERVTGLVQGKDFIVASAPEFLREVSALDDALNPWMTVVGCRDTYARHRLSELFAPLGGEMRVFDDPTVAEMIKIVHNNFNAAKISFFNEIHRISTSIGIDAMAVSEVVVRSAEGQRNPEYGIKGGYAFGGACLPKDLDGLIGFARSQNIPVPLLEAVREVNQSFEIR